jgi:hypothetical protein
MLDAVLMSSPQIFLDWRFRKISIKDISRNRQVNTMLCNCKQSKAVPIRGMAAYRQKRGIASLIFNLGPRWRSMANFETRLLYRRQRTSVPIKYEICWAPDTVWTIRKREKHLDPDWIWNSGSKVRRPGDLSYAELCTYCKPRGDAICNS